MARTPHARPWSGPAGFIRSPAPRYGSEVPDAAGASTNRIQRVGAYAVCLDGDGAILLSRYTSGVWGLPGGGVEHGEHPEETVVREVAEETGLSVSVRYLIGIYSDVWPARAGRDVHALNVVYRAEVLAGELRHEVNGSSDQAGWIPLVGLGDVPHTALLDEVLRADHPG